MKNIVSILVIIASIGIFFGYIKPSYGTIKEQRTELASYKDTLEQAKQLEQTVAGFKTKIDGLDLEGMKKLEKMLPDSISNVNLIIDINNIAGNSGLSIRNIQLAQLAPSKVAKETTTKNSLYDSIDLSFNVMASYSTFQVFASDIEKSLRLVDITSVSFTPTEAVDKYVFKVTLRTYWLK